MTEGTIPGTLRLPLFLRADLKKGRSSARTAMAGCSPLLRCSRQLAPGVTALASQKTTDNLVGCPTNEPLDSSNL